MGILLDELLERLPTDTQTRVNRTKDNLNNVVREVLRQETALRLNRQDNDGGVDPRRSEAVGIRVSLEPGLPEALRARQIDEKYRLAVLLAPWRHTLELLRDSSGAINADLIPQIMCNVAGAKAVGSRQRHLPAAHKLAEDLLRHALRFDLARWILEVNQDVLGVYRYNLRHSQTTPDPQEGRVMLYWGIIGLVARVLAVEVEDLTAVVLAHELAHAYTHLGLDIDGHRWHSRDFHGSELEVKEGLAQYYTWAVCGKLGRYSPGAIRAYETLLKHQPKAYQVHQKWITDYKPEEIRLALIEIRRRDTGKLADFNAALRNAKSRLRRQQRQPQDLQPSLLS